MNQYEDEVIKLQKRIQKIDADPDPTKLKSNKVLYELFLEEAKERLQAWNEGRPFCDHLGVLARSMGFMGTGNVEAAFATRQPQKYLAKAREMGLPIDTSCDMSIMPFTMMESGDLPQTVLNICEGTAPCTPMKIRSVYITHKTKMLSYPFDAGIEADEDNFNYCLKQLYGFIEFAEKIPGIKYDEAKLKQFQDWEEEGKQIVYQIFDLLKAKPAPIAGKDALRIGLRPTQVYTPLAIKAMKARRDEVAERVAKGVAAVPGEKLRVIWTITNPVFMDVFKVLADRKVACLTQYEGGPMRRWAPIPHKDPEFLEGRKLSPVEKIAKEMIGGSFKHATGWVDGMIWVCKQLGVEGVINYNMLGCTEILGIRKIIEDRAEKELGIPTLQLEGKQWDSMYADEATITNKLDEFIQLCMSRKGS
jgi:benzoyl-CoA reductase/2-hydroxyglutaryl-CoA dehydratase subunit BcrC/BadD/HgdB